MCHPDKPEQLGFGLVCRQFGGWSRGVMRFKVNEAVQFDTGI